MSMNARPKISNIEDLKQYFIKELNAENRRISFFTGAGISISQPSCIPLANDVITGILNALCIDRETLKYRISYSGEKKVCKESLAQYYINTNKKNGIAL